MESKDTLPQTHETKIDQAQLVISSDEDEEEEMDQIDDLKPG